MSGLFPERNPELDFIVHYVAGSDSRDKFSLIDIKDTGEDDDWDNIPTIVIDVPQVLKDQHEVERIKAAEAVEAAKKAAEEG